MLRIHFTAEDRGRVRFAQATDPLWETVLSVHQLVGPAAFFAPWQRRARATLSTARLGADLTLLTTLAPARSYFPDFLTPAYDSPGCVDGAIDTVLSTRPRRLRTDIGLLAEGLPRPPVWLDDIAHGRPAALARLGSALRRYYAAAIAPYLADMAQGTAHVRDTLARRALTEGPETVLGFLTPTTRWRPPVLEVDYPVERDLHLYGRGLTLIPSFFCHHHPIALADPALPPVLVYPAGRGRVWIPRTGSDPRAASALEFLIGPTRAAALRSLAVGHTTSALAARISTSVPTASRHAAALRHAGLVSTERQGTSVLHTRTPLGTRLVHGW